MQCKFSAQFPGFISRPEFQIFFNDTFSNDFNPLFNALPVDQLYMAAGVPGFFLSIVPKRSINFKHSSFSCQWLWEVLREVLLKDSRAWNKDKISYVRNSCEVKKASAAQFMSDFKAFISARSEELAPGGWRVNGHIHPLQERWIWTMHIGSNGCLGRCVHWYG